MNYSSIEKFKKNFLDLKEPIVLYGVGNGSRSIVETCREYNIKGVLDREKKDGFFGGKPILTFEKVSNMGVKKIVIAAIPVNVGIIYRRIKETCEALSIDVYNLEGENLSKLYQDAIVDIPYFNRNWGELKEIANKCDVISFDIFDTLLTRKIIKPIDLFEAMEHVLHNTKYQNIAFKENRIKALEIAIEKYKEPYIEDIYSEFGKIVNISQNDCDELKLIEHALERELIIPRQSMVDFFMKCKAEKRVYLVSNMYWRKKDLEVFLSDNGIEGYEDLIVSCEYKLNKKNGLFEVLKNRSSVSPEKILHIGDSEYMDGDCASNAGLHTYIIMEKSVMLQNSFLSNLVDYSRNIINNYIIGNIMAVIFDDPFIFYGMKGRIKVDSLNKYIKAVLVPCGLIYSLWIIDTVRNENVDYILYTSRDGYIIKKIIDALVDGTGFPEGEYFYTSRQAISAASATCEEDYYEIASRPFCGTLGELFLIRFGLEIAKEKFDLPVNDKYIKEIISENISLIEHKCEDFRLNYMEYTNSLDIPKNKKIAIIDQIGVGNVQRGIERIIPQNNYLGLFIKRTDDKKKQIVCLSFYPQENAYDSKQHLSLATLMFENYFSSRETSVKAFDNKGFPVFEKEVRTKKQLDLLEKMHEHTIKMVNGLKSVFGDVTNIDVNWEMMDCILSLLDETVAEISVNELSELVLEDNFGSAGSIDVK